MEGSRDPSPWLASIAGGPRETRRKGMWWRKHSRIDVMKGRRLWWKRPEMFVDVSVSVSRSRNTDRSVSPSGSTDRELREGSEPTVTYACAFQSVILVSVLGNSTSPSSGSKESWSTCSLSVGFSCPGKLKVLGTPGQCQSPLPAEQRN